MKDLKTLSEELRDRAELAKENTQLKKTISGYETDFRNLKTENTRLSTINSEREKNITELKATVAQTFPKDSISRSIHQGAAERIVPNVLTIGVKTVYDSSASLTINGFSKNLDVGTPYIITLGESSCKIEIIKLHEQTVDVVVSCFEK